MSSQNKYTTDELKDFALQAQDYLGTNLFVDDIFSDQLNNYFNYYYNPVKDYLELKFELDSGEAFLIIDNLSTTSNFQLSANLESEILLNYDDTCSY